MTSVTDILKITVGKRWPLILALFVGEIVIIVVVSSLPFFPSELSTYQNQYNNLAPVLNASAPIQVSAIFANNFKVATVELVPAIGLAVFGLSLYETARVVEAIATIKGFSVAFALGNLFFLPSTWLELPAYAVAAAESVYLVYAIYQGFKRGRAYFLRELRFLLVNILVIGVVLTVAALFEVSEIQIASGPLQNQPYALLTWIPFVLVLALFIRFWRRARKDAPFLESHEAPIFASPSSPPKAGQVGLSGSSEPLDKDSEKGAAGSPASSPWG